MAAAYISPAAEGAKPSAAQPRHSGVRKTLENLIHLIFLLCGVVAVAFVLLISIYLILSGIPAIREIGLGKFLFGKVWDPTNTTTGAQYGILAFILTSIYGTAGAILIGVPVGLLTAVFLARVAPPRLAAVIRTAVQLLAGIPSVVYGLVGMIVLVPAIQKTFSLSSGACLLAAILVLAVMILPSIINVSETALRAVPHEYEEASLALGATEMETELPRRSARRAQRRGRRLWCSAWAAPSARPWPSLWSRATSPICRDSLPPCASSPPASSPAWPMPLSAACISRRSTPSRWCCFCSSCSSTWC